MSVGVLSLDQEIGASDAVQLDPLTEEAFIANLHQRFKRDQIYVSTPLSHSSFRVPSGGSYNTAALE
ncbi:hypothetical protein TNCV_4648961 [Trichonephila clavipes]|uniref:Uncharacterized protein n=1 Tax=Trichonephila clavipes TaxID=2585209 RepID=A0A8X6STI0_TRICX|nr:hypothetical protein TNCV_4648961 [Trichonephila clavipes]